MKPKRKKLKKLSDLQSHLPRGVVSVDLATLFPLKDQKRSDANCCLYCGFSITTIRDLGALVEAAKFKYDASKVVFVSPRPAGRRCVVHVPLHLGKDATFSDIPNNKWAGFASGCLTHPVMPRHGLMGWFFTKTKELYLAQDKV